MPYCVSNTHSASMSAARVSRGGNEQDVSTTTVHPKPAFTKVCFRSEAVTRRVYETRGDSGNYSKLCRR